EDSHWKGNRGRITAETIKQQCGSLDGKTFFICGSNKMNDEMTQTLLGLGVPKEQIITEKWGDY
ncbi:MAG: oxidoreductase, partial [Candidatus Micrarchaeota archaeon]|nr:oxidoreductase [Candidatus Micrarchaeota archaeon]